MFYSVNFFGMKSPGEIARALRVHRAAFFAQKKPENHIRLVRKEERNLIFHNERRRYKTAEKKVNSSGHL